MGVWSPKVAETINKAAKPALTAKEALSAKAKAAQAALAQKSKHAEAAHAERAAEPSAISPELISAGWEGATAALRTAGEANAQALVDAWFNAGNAAAIAAVTEADDAPSSAKKAAKRALSVLKSRGVAVPSKPHVVRFTEREESIEATFLPPDLSGTSSISITTRDSSGRYHIAEVIVREPAGIIHAGSGWLSGSQLREGRAKALESVGVAPVAVPVEWARYRIAEARKLNAASRQVLPLGLERCRELIEPVPEAEPTHPIADLEGAITSDLASSRVPGSMSLHEEPEFRSWMPDRASLDGLLQNLGKRLGADGLRDSALVNAALEEEVALATDRFFSPEIRSLIAKRMRDGAISVRARKGDSRATDVLAIARAVLEAGLITSPPREIPFLLAFFQKGIGALAHQGGGSLRIPVAPGSAGAGAGGGEPSADEQAAPEAGAE